MHLTWARFISLVFLLSLTQCGGGAVVVSSTPRPDPVPPPAPLSPPQGQLNVPDLDLEWTPASIGAGRGSMLVKALAAQQEVALVLDQGAGPALQDKVLRMVKAATPQVAVVARGTGILDLLLEERGEIPYRVTLQPGGTDVLGRPYYLPKEHPLNTDWLGRKKALKGADAVLTVRRIGVDDVTLRRLREGHQGGCAPLEAALLSSREEAQKFFNPFQKFAGKALTEAFTRHLAVALPFWQDELRRLAQASAPGGGDRRCVEAYQSFLSQYEICLNGPCAAGPQLHLARGGVVAIADGAAGLPGGCPPPGMRQYEAELADLARHAVGDVLPALKGQWAGELVRLGGLQSLTEGLAQVCAPRHRRIRPADLSAARSLIAKYANTLGTGQFVGDWQIEEGREQIPGTGPVLVLGRVVPQQEQPGRQAGELVGKIRAFDICDEGGERIYQAVLVSVGSSEVLFAAIFFEEELLCEDLSP